MYCSQKLCEDFAKFCDLLRIYEVYLTNREIKSAKSFSKTIFPYELLERMKDLHFHSSYVSKKTRHELQKLL